MILPEGDRLDGVIPARLHCNVGCRQMNGGRFLETLINEFISVTYVVLQTVLTADCQDSVLLAAFTVCRLLVLYKESILEQVQRPGLSQTSSCVRVQVKNLAAAPAGQCCCKSSAPCQLRGKSCSNRAAELICWKQQYTFQPHACVREGACYLGRHA